MSTTADLKQQAYRHIRRKLVYPSLVTRGSLSDRNVARELGISRTPVREAIRQLEFEGLVEQRPRSGTFPRLLTTEEWEHLLDIREALEGYAAYRAATRITPAQLRKLDQRCEQMRQVADRIAKGKYKQWDMALLEPLVEADMEFHRTLLRASENPTAATMVDRCQVLVRSFESECELKLPVDRVLYDRLMETRDQHAAIADALRRGDADGAREAVLQHLRSGRDYYAADMRKMRPDGQEKD